MEAFGRCIVKNNPALAREFVLRGNEHWFDKKFHSLPTPGCLGDALFGAGLSGGTLAFMPTVLRYIVAEALVRTDLADFNAATISSAAPLPPPRVSRDDFRDRQAFANAQNDVALFNFGECVVRAKPSQAQRLLNTKINSKDEGQALLELVPTFGSCLDVGHQFVTDRQILRGIIAFDYYRLAYAPRVASAPPGNVAATE
jgi:hypothetical protein